MSSDNRSACVRAIGRSRLISEVDKEAWVARVDSWTEAKCAHFLKVVGKESEFLMKGLRAVLDKALVAGDKETVGAFKQTFTAATRSVSAKEEASDKIKESETLKRLESDLNAI